jgi:putative transcriptional regulator
MKRREFLLGCMAAGLLRAQQPALGKVLVASPKTADPDFKRSVIVLVHHGGEGTVGFMINRPIDAPLSEVFRDIKPENDRKGFLFIGGPVPMGINALVRSHAAPEGGHRVLSDVYLVPDRGQAGKLAIAAQTSGLRIFVGSCGWAPGQLQMELDRGYWTVVRGTADLVFDPKPVSLWVRLTAAQA